MNIYIYIYIYIYISASVYTYSSIDTNAAWKKSRLILSDESVFHMIESL